MNATSRPGPDVVAVGGANVDIKLQSLAPLVSGTSNPCSAARSHGGVARNVAEGLARLGLRVAFVSRVGSDIGGDQMMVALHSHGVDTSRVTRSLTAPTASYTAILDVTGEMAVAGIDLAIYAEVEPGHVARALQAFDDPRILFVDANFEEASIAAALDAAPRALRAADAVSMAHAPKLRSLLPRLDLVFANRDEVPAITGGARFEDPIAAAGALVEAGAAAAVVMAGGEGAGFAERRGTRDRLPALRALVREVTGAGDNLIAGTLYGIARGLPLAAALRYGLAASALAVESEMTVPTNLSRATLDARLAQTGSLA